VEYYKWNTKDNCMAWKIKHENNLSEKLLSRGLKRDGAATPSPVTNENIRLAYLTPVS
jgi:hypothetical protein